MLSLTLSACVPPQDQHFQTGAYPALTDVYWFQGVSGGPVAVDAAGNIWQADEDIGSEEPRVELITRQGKLTFIRDPSITDPHAVVIAPDKTVWIANAGAEYFPQVYASLTRVWPTPMRSIRLPHKTADVEGIIFENNGAAWFSETDLNRVGVVRPNGRIVEYQIPFVAGPRKLYLIDGVEYLSTAMLRKTRYLR